MIDEDGINRESVLAECRHRTTRRQKWCCVAARPCFEVWWIAHYEQGRNYQDQHEAQRHWARVSGVATGDKKLPNDFPFDAMDDAIGWSNLAGSEVTGINELPPFPGSGMPALLNALGLSSGDTALT